MSASYTRPLRRDLINFEKHLSKNKAAQKSWQKFFDESDFARRCLEPTPTVQGTVYKLFEIYEMISHGSAATVYEIFLLGDELNAQGVVDDNLRPNIYWSEELVGNAIRSLKKKGKLAASARVYLTDRMTSYMTYFVAENASDVKNENVSETKTGYEPALEDSVTIKMTIKSKELNNLYNLLVENGYTPKIAEIVTLFGKQMQDTSS